MADHADRRREKWRAAMKAKAEFKAEEGERILDELADGERLLTPADVTLATARSKYRQWLAGSLDRETYGDQKQQQSAVVLNVGTLHLDALRAVGGAKVLPAAPGAESGPVVDAEILEEVAS